jgi:hypothetical protein
MRWEVLLPLATFPEACPWPIEQVLETVARPPGSKAKVVDLTREGRHRVAARTASCE